MQSGRSSRPNRRVDELSQAGIAAARAGQPGWARDLLTRAIELDEGNVKAWLWLSQAVDTLEEKQECLERVLSLDPDHEVARRGLAWLHMKLEAGTPPAVAPPDAAPSVSVPPAAVPAAATMGAESAAPVPAPAPIPAAGDAGRQERLDDRNLGVDELLQAGTAAARAGQSGRARDLLSRVIERDEKYVSAWLWLSYVAESAEERTQVVQRMLRATAPAGHGLQLAGVAVVPAGGTTTVSAGSATAMPPPYAGLGRLSAWPSLELDAAAAFQGLRSLYQEWASAWSLTSLAYMGAMAMAELITTFVDPRLGLAAHGVLLLILFLHAASVDSKVERAFLVSLCFAPLIRILSLSLPLAQIPILYWYLITSVPLFAALLVAVPVLGFSWPKLGLNLRRWPLQLAIGLTGLLFGAMEYLILQPDPLAPALRLSQFWWPALILLLCTGLLEEMIFRGLLQRTAADALQWAGMVYVAFLFAVLHIGYASLTDFFFVLLVGLFFGWVVQHTRSLLGVTLSHGLTNITLFLVMPFLNF